MRSSPKLLALCAALAVAGLPANRAEAQAGPPLSPVPSPTARPQPGGPEVPLTLADAVAIGLRDNRTIKSAYLQRIAQKYDLFVNTNPFLPRLNLRASLEGGRISGTDQKDFILSPTAQWRSPTGASVNFSWVRQEALGAHGPGPTETASLVISQPLLRGAGLDVNLAPVRLARLQEQTNRLQLKATVSGAVSSIVFAYRNLLQAQEQVHLAERSLDRTRALLDVNRALIAAGRMAPADIFQTESNLANQDVALIQARQQKVAAQLKLLELLAVDPRTNVLASDAIDIQRAVIEQDRVLSLALQSRTDLLAQRAALEQARIAVRLARNNRLWDLSARAEVSRQKGPDPILGGAVDHGTDVRLGLRLDIPLGDLSLRQQEGQAGVDLKTQELRYDGLLQTVENGVIDAVQRVEASWLQVEATRRAKALTERALDAQRRKLSAGRASNFEVLSLQGDLQAADVQELSASIAYLDALTSLDEFIGSTLDTWHIDLND